jgi:MerR family copper efflux transcriptional regulator
VHTLQFIRRSRELGFALSQIGELVGLWRDRTRPSREVKALAETHIKELEQKAEEILAMKSALQHLVRCCRGDERPDCPILDDLAGHGQVPKATSANATKVRRRQQETPSARPRTAI